MFYTKKYHNYIQEAYLAPDYTRDKVNSPWWEGVINDNAIQTV